MKLAVNTIRVLFITIVTLLTLTPPSANANTVRYYQYTDESGRVVIDDKIPPEFVNRGYKVLDKWSNVIDEVAPVLDEQERERLRREEAQRTKDLDLLRRYGSLLDIEVAEERFKKEMQASISILRANRNMSKKRLAELNKTIESLEGNNRVVPPRYLEDRTDLLEDIANSDEQIEHRQRELEEGLKTFDNEEQRYKELKSIRDSQTNS